MPGGVSRDTVARMEAALERVYKSPQWKEHAEKNMFENIWMGSAEYAKHLAFRLTQQREFLTAVGIIQKQ